MQLICEYNKKTALLRGFSDGAGEGNRTLDNSLEGCGFTTKLHPQ